jgi:hypothetical protein
MWVLPLAHRVLTAPCAGRVHPPRASSGVGDPQLSWADSGGRTMVSVPLADAVASGSVSAAQAAAASAAREVLCEKLASFDDPLADAYLSALDGEVCGWARLSCRAVPCAACYELCAMLPLLLDVPP